MSNIPAWIHFLGYIGSVAGVGMAVYLQFVVNRKIPPQYVVGFFAIGCSLFFLTIRPPQFDNATVSALRTLGYVILITFEIIGFYEVRNEVSLFREKPS